VSVIERTAIKMEDSSQLQYELEEIIKSRCDEIGIEYVEPDPLLQKEIKSIIEKRCDELGIPYEDEVTKQTEEHRSSPSKRVIIRRRNKKHNHARKMSLESDIDLEVNSKVDEDTEKTIISNNAKPQSDTDEEDDAYWRRMIEMRRRENMACVKLSQLNVTND